MNGNQLQTCQKERNIWIVVAIIFILTTAITIFIAFAYAPPSFFLDWVKTTPQTIFVWVLVLIIAMFSILTFVYSYLNHKQLQTKKVR